MKASHILLFLILPLSLLLADSSSDFAIRSVNPSSFSQHGKHPRLLAVVRPHFHHSLTGYPVGGRYCQRRCGQLHPLHTDR